MKKKFVIGVLIMILLIMLIPRKKYLEDGGSVVYSAILYKVTDVKEISGDTPDKEYQEGIKIEILGLEIFNDVT